MHHPCRYRVGLKATVDERHNGWPRVAQSKPYEGSSVEPRSHEPNSYHCKVAYGARLLSHCLLPILGIGRSENALRRVQGCSVVVHQVLMESSEERERHVVKP